MAVKVTDGILLSGKIQELYKFVEAIYARYEVRKAIIDDVINFNGCEIYQESDGNIHMDMTTFMQKIKPIEIDKERRKKQSENATKREIDTFRSLAGALLWIGCAVMPQASCVASFMQQNMNRLQVRNLIEANAQLKEVRERPCRIRYDTHTQTTTTSICTFSDASFNISYSHDYVRT